MESASATPNLQAIPRARWWRIITPAMIIYVIAYMDRVNISFAMAGGMNEALGLSMTVSGLAAGIFFWGYLVLQVPGGHIAEHGSAKKFVMWTIIAWGGISFLTGFVQNSWQLLAMRFLLGVAEGGVYPAILVVIGKWFPQKELGRANGLFLISLPLSAAVTNPISGWVVTHYSWRGLFFFEGVVSLALIFIWMPLISDCPEDAMWIS
jgi:MFS family permease